MKQEEGTFEGVKGFKIYYQAWIPNEPKAVVQFVHGGGGHSGLAPHLVNKLISERFAFFADDLRGHGRSEGDRVHVDSLDYFIEDEKSLYDIIKIQYPNLPIFMGGISLGSIIAFHFTKKYESLLKGLFLSGTVASAKIPLFTRFLLRIFSAIRPHMRIGKPGDLEASSKNPETIRMYETDPLYAHVALTMRFGREVLKGMNKQTKTAGTLKLPLLIQNGADDKVNEVFNARNDELAFKEIYTMDDLTIKIYEGVSHDIFNDFEENRKLILQDLTDWLNNHI